MNELTWRSDTVQGHRGWAFCFGIAACAALVVLAAQPSHAQERTRINRLIEALERGDPAITNDVWIFIDQEHQPYQIAQLGTRLADLAAEKTERGQQRLAPFVRIPAEGDQDVRWIIKQVLERGAMGLIVPQVENAAQATKIVQAMRYPQRKEAPYPEPAGRRGFAGAPRTWGLRVMDYVAVADLWPLNPDGELFVLPMIENAEGVRNVNEILDVSGVGGVLVGPSDLAMQPRRGGVEHGRAGVQPAGYRGRYSDGGRRVRREAEGLRHGDVD